ncbi:hypothetical protein WA026_000161 [Henosepilachna vigintioctopunctata]|uniref:Uncharacterized protein n=1 Tax=Henosepilachna vigintioctopunctata TaxID=420089 RepID=A0AAW1UXJ8_9CUCU
MITSIPPKPQQRELQTINRYPYVKQKVQHLILEAAYVDTVKKTQSNALKTADSSSLLPHHWPDLNNPLAFGNKTPCKPIPACKMINDAISFVSGITEGVNHSLNYYYGTLFKGCLPPFNTSC